MENSKELNSILLTVKTMLGPGIDDTTFDTDLIIHINSVLSTLVQLGVGPSDGFTIHDEKATWFEFLGARKDLEQIKSYVYMKVKLLFDPPQSSSTAKAYEDMCKEFEWRAYITCDPPLPKDEVKNQNELL